MSDGVFIQFVCQVFNLMVILIEVCQRFVCLVYVNSPHFSNEDHAMYIQISYRIASRHQQIQLLQTAPTQRSQQSPT